MGNTAFLEQPITDKTTTAKETQKYLISSCEMQGWRRYMQDAYIAYPNVQDHEDIAIYGVFDGHGGSQTAKYTAKHFIEIFQKRFSSNKDLNVGEVLKETFIHIELTMKTKPAIAEMIEYKKEAMGKPVTEQELQSGCTAVVVAVTKDKIICANAGDSRAALCRKSTVEALSEDHKPQNPIEKERIEKTGVPIVQGRVNGLNLTRSIGDFSHKQVPGLQFHKQPVICVPDIVEKDREATDQFLLLGCDGIWEKYGDDFVVLTEEFRQSLAQHKSEGKKAGEKALVEFFDRNINPNDQNPHGRDNMTALIVQFKKAA